MAAHCLSNVVASQIDIHRKFGGVVPEIASPEHLRQNRSVVREALAKLPWQFSDVDAVGVTQAPAPDGRAACGHHLRQAPPPRLSVNH